MSNDVITLAHGSGGQAMGQLIENLLVKQFDNPYLRRGEDQARIALSSMNSESGTLAMTTDSFVIDPLEFPGGDIGKLAICGTANDLAVGGARPQYLTCSLILEEGLAIARLEKIIQSMAHTARQANIQIVTGDTKVVGRGNADKLFINTTGIGFIDPRTHWGMEQITAGDDIIVTGTLGDHGGAILNQRENLGLGDALQSDCAVLWPLVEPLVHIAGVHTLRDATRGGVNAILHEFAKTSGLGFEVSEVLLPVSDAVRGMCELLGLEPLNLANEGKLIIICKNSATTQVLTQLHNHPLGANATVIGQVQEKPGVRLKGAYGVTRSLELPYFEPLPRIC
ncbi:hydrogenase expression/formation protein HypE [Celerinatantimonas diazotrophica]|uniref:Hydrogenase maturation carbamoyl dehydratase HypE n=1 Tax=Celerinatantimonas diazotrophica TaxID=412034 RepID=A0A4R1K9R9_9GAMM|nr:hydrogenase expression/formation protein HypE [Celerinatantimonas diazotrophica]TCK61104.1 hydrogenase maturation carbamoyl dehydratase HypE [Celerinatantimonas diazotrophica]CAG9295153.1 Carbamoyl dehydratase HypE [Celerinatantimonas diazotrophica]